MQLITIMVEIAIFATNSITDLIIGISLVLGVTILFCLKHNCQLLEAFTCCHTLLVTTG